MSLIFLNSITIELNNDQWYVKFFTYFFIFTFLQIDPQPNAESQVFKLFW